MRPSRLAGARRRARAVVPADIDSRFTPVTAAFVGLRGVVIEPGWGKGTMVLKAGAKIFALLGDVGFVVKLRKVRVDELVAAGHGTRFDPRKNGRVMKEWLVATAGADWAALSLEAHAFVAAGAGRRARRP